MVSDSDIKIHKNVRLLSAPVSPDEKERRLVRRQAPLAHRLRRVHDHAGHGTLQKDNRHFRIRRGW